MQELKITGELETFSGISNIFIDHYMAESSGEFVKLYLYLVRLSSAGRPVSVSILADLLHCTEQDVCRGIKYWVSKGVLSLTYSEGKKKVADGIILRQLRVPEASPAEMILLAGEDDLTSEPEDPDAESPAESTADSTSHEDTGDGQAYFPIPEKTRLTPKMINEATRDENLSNLIHEAEAYFNHMLAQGEINSLHYIYRELGFSFDLCEFLLEYTASIGKKSFRYMETVARNWFENRISTREEAEIYTLNYNSLYYAIQRELGMSGSVTGATKNYADKWSNEFGFTKEIILEACRRSVIKKSSQPLPYTDGILKDWHDRNVRSFSDIARLDDEKKASRINRKSKNPSDTESRDTSSPFPQTDMSADMKMIEELYLHMAN